MKERLEKEYKESGKRFALSSEPFAKERLKVLRSAFNEVHVEHPEVISLALYGSMTKGTAVEKSDIDAWVFVDADVLEKQKKTESRQAGHVVDKDVSHGRETYYLKPEIGKRYSGFIRERLKEDGLQQDQVQHIRTLPISRDIIRKSLDRLKKGVQALGKWKFDKEEYDSQITNKNFRAKSPNRPENPDVPLNLYAMFHLSMGTDIRKFRRLLIDELLQEGEIGEAMWKEIIEDTEFMEQGMPMKPTGKRYPRTLKQALGVYGDNKGSA